MELQISKVGFPIRKFSDQSLFAAPRNLSQRTTSFIASQRQGIHRILLRHLIALIIDVHPQAPRQKVLWTFRLPGPIDRYIKTSFASNISGNVRSARSLTGACHTRSDNGEPLLMAHVSIQICFLFTMLDNPQMSEDTAKLLWTSQLGCW